MNSVQIRARRGVFVGFVCVCVCVCVCDLFREIIEADSK